jgi:hypothetical protein
LADRQSGAFGFEPPRIDIASTFDVVGMAPVTPAFGI